MDDSGKKPPVLTPIEKIEQMVGQLLIQQATMLATLANLDKKLDGIASFEEVIADMLTDIAAVEEQILSAVTEDTDIASFGASVSQPVPQKESQMAVKSFAAASPIVQPMLDDQTSTITWTPEGEPDASGNPTPGAIPTGATSPVTTASPGTAVTVVQDPTGLAPVVNGIKGQSGTEVITVTFTNADGTVATNSGAPVSFVITVDPAELDVSGFGASVSTPVPQAPASAKRP